MSVFQIVQLDPAAAKWLGFAKQQCKRIMDTGTKDFYREWTMGDATVKAKSCGGIVKLWLVTGGVTDFVGVAMPNPIPYRKIYLSSSVDAITGAPTNYVIASDGEILASERQDTSANITSNIGDFYIAPNSNWAMVPAGSVFWVGIDYVQNIIKSYPLGRSSTFLDWWFSRLRNPSLSSYIHVGCSEKNAWAFDYNLSTGTFTSSHKINFTAPEDCFLPDLPRTPPSYPGLDGLSNEWNADWLSGVTANDIRRYKWFKKNSDEFIAALKTGFSVDAKNVTRSELKSGHLPMGWELNILSKFNNNYGLYPRDANNIKVGRHTYRKIVFDESLDTDTLVSDTTDQITGAGVKIFKREVVLSYTRSDGTVKQTTITGFLTQTLTPYYIGSYSQMAVLNEYANWYVHSVYGVSIQMSIVGFGYAYLNNIDMPIRSSHTNRLESNIASVINGSKMVGQNTDSSLYDGVTLSKDIFSPLIYDWGFPKSYERISISDIPLFTEQWHAESQVAYDKTGMLGTWIQTGIQNDADLHGVTEIHISPFGLIANGAGIAPINTPLGIFAPQVALLPSGNYSQENDGTQAEIYGTAIYKYNWSTGALTFKSWKPLHDANGNEVASKTVSLGTVLWSTLASNCIVTYKGLHWPDVVSAINLRDKDAKAGTFTYSDPAWWALVQAIKAG